MVGVKTRLTGPEEKLGKPCTCIARTRPLRIAAKKGTQGPANKKGVRGKVDRKGQDKRTPLGFPKSFVLTVIAQKSLRFSGLRSQKESEPTRRSHRKGEKARFAFSGGGKTPFRIELGWFRVSCRLKSEDLEESSQVIIWGWGKEGKIEKGRDLAGIGTFYTRIAVLVTEGGEGWGAEIRDKTQRGVMIMNHEESRIHFKSK